MRGITIQQPWPWAIVHGTKRTENRTWATKHRGLIAIHAGASIDRHALDDPRILAALRAHGAKPDYVTGAVIAVANLLSIHMCPGGCSVWAARDQHHWQLTNVQPLPTPVPARGALGIWDLPPTVSAAVNEQLLTNANR